jgi:Ca2+-binding EF-hand superfamily protein
MASEEGGRAEKGGRVVGGMFLSDDEISAFREVFSLVDKDGSLPPVSLSACQ